MNRESDRPDRDLPRPSDAGGPSRPAPDPDPDPGAADAGEPGPLDRPEQFDWGWIRSASIRELSAHGREVQARMSAGEPPPARRPSLWKRVRFRLFLARQRRRNRGSVSGGG